MTLRNVGLALLLLAIIGVSGEASLRAQPVSCSQTVSELVVSSLRDLTALFTFSSRPAEPAISATAGFRG